MGQLVGIPGLVAPGAMLIVSNLEQDHEDGLEAIKAIVTPTSQGRR